MLNSYTEDQMVHIFLDNLQKYGNYSAQIKIYQEELIREENFIDQKSLSIFDLYIDYFSFKNSVRNHKRENFAQSRCSHRGSSYPTNK